MKALVYEGTNRVMFQEVPMIRPREGWTLIQVAYAGICGSDVTILKGKHPRAKAPLIMGHEFSGTIASDHPRYPRGTLVTAFPYLPCGICERCRNGQFHVCESLKLIGIDLDGGMAEYVQVPDEMICPVPEGIDPQTAAFIEPIGISVHAARKGGYRPGDSVLVFGAGGIGLSVAITLRSFGAEKLMMCEPNPLRRAMAEDLGFEVLDPESDIIKQVYDRTDGMGDDYVYECAGVQPVAELLPDAVKINGRIVVVAGYKTPPVMNFQKGMFREFEIRFVRNCTRQDFTIATGLAGRRLGYEKLLNYTLPLSQGEKGFAPPPSACKVMFCVKENIPHTRQLI